MTEGRPTLVSSMGRARAFDSRLCHALTFVWCVFRIDPILVGGTGRSDRIELARYIKDWNRASRANGRPGTQRQRHLTVRTDLRDQP